LIFPTVSIKSRLKAGFKRIHDAGQSRQILVRTCLPPLGLSPVDERVKICEERDVSRGLPGVSRAQTRPIRPGEEIPPCYDIRSTFGS
jgi:hypothetical protein